MESACVEKKDSSVSHSSEGQDGASRPEQDTPNIITATQQTLNIRHNGNLTDLPIYYHIHIYADCILLK